MLQVALHVRSRFTEAASVALLAGRVLRAGIVGCMLFTLLLCTDPVAAQEPTTEVPYDSTSVGRRGGINRPFWVMMRSAVVPGWGQLHNGSWVKALIFGGAQCGFIYGIVNEDRLAEEDPENSSDHKARKKDYIWWGAFATLLSLGDAYVDAHLDRFNAEFRPEDSAVLLSFEVYP
jgi:hypothetical protein